MLNNVLVADLFLHVHQQALIYTVLLLYLALCPSQVVHKPFLSIHRPLQSVESTVSTMNTRWQSSPAHPKHFFAHRKHLSP